MSVIRSDRWRLLGLAALLVAWGLAGEAAAADGQIEINQASVTAAGGFPYAITAAGSYVLTGNLDLTAADPNVNAINISAPDVVLDLNGFEILGQCPGPLGSCPSAASGGSAISAGRDVWIRNGTVRGMPGVAVYAGDEARIERLRVIRNHYTGIWIGGSNAVVHENVLSDNGWHGIHVDGRALVVGNRADGNAGPGIEVDTNGYGGSVVRGNSVQGNQDALIQVGGEGCVVTGNHVHGGAYGIYAAAGCVVAGNTAGSASQTGIEIADGCAASRNLVSVAGGVGIAAGAAWGSLITGNTVRNGSVVGIETWPTGHCLASGNAVNGVPYGLDLGPDTAYIDNVISATTTTVSGGVPFGQNACNGAPACP